MSIQTEAFTSDGTFSLPSFLISTNITVTVTGGPGNSSTGGLTPGAVISGQLLSTLLPVSVVIGQPAIAWNAGAGFSGGGGGGGWRYGSSTPFWGGGGGGSTAVINASTSAVYMEAGGGDGGSFTFGQGTPSLYPGGSGGGAASNTPDNGANVGNGAGSGGAAGGHGGNGVLFGGPSSGGAGHGGGTNGIDASGATSATGVGSGGLAVLGAGACSADASNVANATYGRSGSTGGSVVFSYHVADAPSAPTLVAPAPNAQIDAFDAGVIFTGIYNAPSADTGSLAAVSLSIDGGTNWWDGTDFTSGTQIWVTPTTGAGVASGGTFTIAVPAGVIPDTGATVLYPWTMACKESFFGLNGPDAPNGSFSSVVPPTLVFVSPVGDVNDLTPTVSWTPTIPYGGVQENYRALIYTTPQTITGVSGPPAGFIYDSGVVDTHVSGDTSFTVPSDTLHSIKNYYLYLQIVNSVGLVPSIWTPDTFTVELISTNTVTLAALSDHEPNTGIPAPRLTMAMSGSDDLETAWFQGDYVGDGSWLDLIGGLGTVTDGGCITWDLGCPFNAPLSYRVRGAGTIGGEQYVTAWSETATLPEIPSYQWATIAPTNLAGSMELHRLPSSASSPTDEIASPTTPAMPGSMAASFISDEWEQMGVFHPFGKSTATIVHGDIWESDFSLDLFFMNPTEWNAFRAIRELQKVVLIKSDMEGTVYWVTLGPDLNPGILSEVERQRSPSRGLTVACTPTDPYVPPNPFVPTQ